MLELSVNGLSSMPGMSQKRGRYQEQQEDREREKEERDKCFSVPTDGLPTAW